LKAHSRIWGSKTGLAGKNLRDLFPRVRGKKGVKWGKRGLIPMFFPLSGGKKGKTYFH